MRRLKNKVFLHAKPCLKMILAHKQHKIIPLVVLGMQCLKYGGYTLPLEESPGLYYKPFVTFIENDYKLNGKAVSTPTLTGIKQTLSNRGYIHLHNPSGFKDSQENVAIPYKQFMKFSDHKGILIDA